MRKLLTSLVVVAVAGGGLAATSGVAQAATPPVDFAPATDFATGALPPSVASGDLSGDGVPDLVTVNYSSDSITVLRGDGSGGFGNRMDHSTGDDPYGLALGDLDGDAALDVVATNYVSDSVSIWLGDGAGGLGARADVSVGDGPYSVAVADLDGDGAQDLAVANAGSSTVSVLLGDGLGGFAAAVDHATGVEPTSVAVEDLDGDTHLDLVVADHGADTVSVLLGDGAGGFAAKTDFATADGPYMLALGDFDSDGATDVVASSFGSSTLSVLFGDGAGGFGTKVDLPTTAATIAVAVGDLNGDTFLDLIGADYGAGTVSVLLGDGAGGFDSATAFGTASGPRSVAVDDFDGDGRADLAVSAYGSNVVSVLLNTTGDPAITVTPDAALIDGQIVTVAGSGWAPGHSIGFCQSVQVDPASSSNCADGLYATVTASGDGTFSAPLTVSRSIFVPSLGAQVDCAAAPGACVVGAADVADLAGTATVAAIEFLGVPGAPTIGVATKGDGQANLSWSAPASDGGSPIVGYVITPYVDGVSQGPRIHLSTATTQVVPGLANGTTYRFRVRALNVLGAEYGVSAFSAQSNPVTPSPPGVPGPPTIGVATAGDGEATVSWSAPASDGGSPIVGYVITPYVDGVSQGPRINLSTATTQVVPGLANGTTYRFRVRALNLLVSGYGVSAFSGPSNPVTPIAAG